MNEFYEQCDVRGVIYRDRIEIGSSFANCAAFHRKC